MKITMPSDCGNAPRLGIVGDFAVNWAAGDAAALSLWLSDDARWTVVGAGIHSGPGAAGQAMPPFTPERVQVISVITHGRLASCDGYLEAGSRRVAFSHTFRFAGASKTAKVVELRSYCIETQDS
ncbi:hypothetical protein ACFYLX_04195 [Pseudarthrobacter enclensis]|uniref:hypothetical protein n=1 Tax=Pseudarthrobacter enclensis TaxID=993070 RepID=UPI00368E86AB